MSWQRRFQPTALSDRANFVRMWMTGMSFRAIALATGASVSTVYRWIHRWKLEGNVNTKFHRHRLIKEQKRKDIVAALPLPVLPRPRTSMDYTYILMNNLGSKPIPRFFLERIRHNPAAYSHNLKMFAMIHYIRSYSQPGFVYSSSSIANWKKNIGIQGSSSWFHDKLPINHKVNKREKVTP